MSNEEKSPSHIEPGQDWQVDRFAPEDAEGVVKLFRSVYGDGYPIRTYMEPELLVAENAANRTISSVARTPKGEIVGHNALFNSAPHPGTFESGAGVVHAAYRGGKGIFTELVAHGLEYAVTLPVVDAIFGEPVCNHPFSQKMTIRLGFVTRALEVDLMPAAAYAKEESATGRVTALLEFKPLRAKPHTVYLPSVYQNELRFLYENLDDQRDYQLAEAAIPEGLESDIRPRIFDFAAVARVAIHQVGSDFALRMAELETMLAENKVLVIQLWLKLDCPWLGSAVEILRQRGYFLGGVLPRWFDHDGLLMQKICKQPDWEGILAYTERAVRVLELVKADWQRSLQ